MRIQIAALIVVTSMMLAACGGMQKPAGDAGGVGGSGNAQKPPTQQQQPPTAKKEVKQWAEPPAMQIDTAKTYYATIQTSLGDMKIELLAKESPKTVNNFVFLAKEGFYDGIIFHRILDGFMVQTGDPLGNGTGNPGYRFEDELPPKHSYEKGIVAMANAGPNTNGSQFFICNSDGCKTLDRLPNYTQFGRLVEGEDTLEKLSKVEVTSGPNGEPSKPVDPPVIKTVIITEGK